MTLTTNGKNWLAQNAGSGNCFTSGGVSYRDPDGVSRTGSTGDIVNAFYTAHSVDLDSAVIIAGTNYSGFKSRNSGSDLSMSDVGAAYGMESGSSQYCYSSGGGGGTPPPIDCEPYSTRCNAGNVETCNSDGNGWIITDYCGSAGCTYSNYEAKCNSSGGGGGDQEGDLKCIGDDVYRYTNGAWKYVKYCPAGCSGGVCQTGGGGSTGGSTETPPFEVYVGGGASCPAGSPSVILDTSAAFAYFKAQPAIYVGVMDIDVTNLNTECYAYFAWEMRMWDGHGYTSCPDEDPEYTQISRFLAEVSDNKVITLKRLDATATDMISGSFEIPSYYEGKKTICLSLWGDFSYTKLVADLAAAGYQKEIPW